ncbi:hypothetical protein ACHAW6_005633 [Cyclotella cf. meneghiniana]
MMTNLISIRTTTRLRQCRSGIAIIVYAFLALFCSYNVAHAYSLQRPVSMSSRFGMRISGSFLPSHELMSNVSNRSQGLKISSRSSSLSMHMGHSHSHHHHEHSHISTTPKRPIARTAIRILFAALLALTPRLVSLLSPKKIISSHSIKGEAAAFILLSSLFAIADRIREQTNQLIQKGQKWRLSMLKHSTPLSADYFFKNENAADKVTFLGVIINLILSGGKVVAGVLCHSSALVADAGHSLSDLFSDFVTLWAVQVGRLPPDDDHPYGHGKFESIGSLFLSLTLLGTGLSVGLSSYMKFVQVIALQRSSGMASAASLIELPTWPALIVAFISIVSKEWLYRITRKVGEELNSQVVIANAWHHRSDAYSSVLALISIGLAMSIPGFLAADPLAGMLVAGMIAMTGAEIMGESMKQLTDAVTDEELVKSVEYVSREDPDVKDVKRVRARQVGSKALVDVEVETPPDLSASAMRAIEERIRVRILADVDGVLDAEVRATGHDLVFCPLLTAIEDTDLDNHMSATIVEGKARGLLEAHPDVLSVEGVTVHYQDTVSVRVDANICVDPSRTVSEANALAVTLRKLLEEGKDNNIDQANIFLDLNSHVSNDGSRETTLA